MLRIIIAIITLTAACTFRAAAQVVCIGGHYGLVDNTARRILVSCSHHDATLPATYSYEGTDYDVDTTTLPLVLLDHDVLASDEYRRGTLTLIDPEAPAGDAPFVCPADLRYRGATSLAYDKKNYAVKLLDPTTAGVPDGLLPLDASLLGMRTDNSWILDAMASDCSRLRNRASTDLWLDFSRKPYYADEEPTMVNGTHGRFVEAFVADRYWGIYCLTEKVDRKQLRVKKFKDGAPRGIIYKSFTYDNMMHITEPSPDNLSYTWQGWEAAYPDNRKGEPFDWTPLLDLYTFLGQEVPSFDLLDHLHLHLDIPVWRDYVIFCDLMHADDNVAKNMIVYFRDVTQPATYVSEQGKDVTAPAPGPLSICPWDLDATWGRDFMRNPIEPTHNCNVSNAPNFHLWASQYDQGKLYYTRWAELRESIFTPDGLWAYFERYFDLFEQSGAAARETERWQDVNNVHLDFDAERAYIRRWIGYRLGYLDGDYDYVDTGIASLTPDATHTDAPVYTLDGRTIARCPAGTTPASTGLPAGIYLCRGRKYIVR